MKSALVCMKIFYSLWYFEWIKSLWRKSYEYLYLNLRGHINRLSINLNIITSNITLLSFMSSIVSLLRELFDI